MAKVVSSEGSTSSGKNDTVPTPETRSDAQEDPSTNLDTNDINIFDEQEKASSSTEKEDDSHTISKESGPEDEKCEKGIETSKDSDKGESNAKSSSPKNISTDFDAEETCKVCPEDSMVECKNTSHSEKGDPASTQEKNTDEEDDHEEVWDLTKIFNISDLTKKEPIMCNNEECLLLACSEWTSNLDPGNPWYTCIDCQETDYGGWPEAVELPLKIMREEHIHLIAEKCSREESPTMPSLPGDADTMTKDSDPDPIGKQNHNKKALIALTETENSDKNENEEQDEDGWDLKKIYSLSELMKPELVMCNTEGCLLIACSKWISTNDPTDRWNSCLDCQEADYEGWPERNELPITTMNDEHRRLIAEKCSRQGSPKMPDLPLGAPTSTCSPSHQKSKIASITPPPGDRQKPKINNKKGNVTPSPVPPKQSKPSAAALAMHRKWQEAAEKIGGPDARIVVKKPDAKKLIFDMLHESFQPMNITDIFKKLKAVVPSPVLKSCLDDMSLDKDDNPFDESDDEEGATKPKRGATSSKLSSTDDPFARSLLLKAGRNSNNVLYFVDHSRLHNNGNGLLPDERNALAGSFESAKYEEELLNQKLTQLNTAANQLLSEPLNTDIFTILEKEEHVMTSLNQELESARELVVDEKIKKQIKTRLDAMTAQWRKRKRICMDFLMLMEEMTEGTVSIKKCMSGDGQMDIDSDEAVAKGAIAFGKKKALKGLSGLKRSSTIGGMQSNKRIKLDEQTGGSIMVPTESFVAVKLDSQGNVARIHFDEEE